MRSRISLFLCLTVLLICAGRINGETADATATNSMRSGPLPQNTGSLANRIERVENGLLLPVMIKGQPAAQMNLADRMQFYKIPGVSVAVINHGVIEWARGYGVREAGGQEPVRTETLFQAGSISKPLCALAALRLVQQGKLELDEDVNQELTSWRIPESELTNEHKVTLRELLSHSAGITVHGFLGYALPRARCLS